MMSLEEMQVSARKHLWTAGMTGKLIHKMGPIVFVKGEGIYLYSSDGKRFYDAMSGAWVVNVGHGRHEIVQAMAEQAKQLAYVLQEGYTSVPAVYLAERLATMAPGGLNRVFFCCGGSEAVESALKLTRQYFVFKDGRPRYKVISRRFSYHGATFGAMGATGFDGWRWPFAPHVPGIKNVPHPYCYKCEFDSSYPACALRCVEMLERTIIEEGPENVGAFIAEPISMSAGTAVPPPDYWRAVRDVCDKYGVFLIADEVITGFGRTGRWFGLDHWGIVPDILVVGKGITSGYAPLAAIITREDIAMVLDEQGFIHGFTYSGHPVACAAALKNIEIIERENLVYRAAMMGEKAKELMTTLLSDHPFVGEIRTFGLLGTVELVSDKKTRSRLAGGQATADALRLKLLEQGLACRVGSQILFGPPLIVKEEELKEMILIIRAGLDWLYESL